MDGRTLINSSISGIVQRLGYSAFTSSDLKYRKDPGSIPGTGNISFCTFDGLHLLDWRRVHPEQTVVPLMFTFILLLKSSSRSFVKTCSNKARAVQRRIGTCVLIVSTPLKARSYIHLHLHTCILPMWRGQLIKHFVSFFPDLVSGQVRLRVNLVLRHTSSAPHLQRQTRLPVLQSTPVLIKTSIPANPK